MRQAPRFGRSGSQTASSSARRDGEPPDAAAETWDGEYRRGDWEYLHSLSEGVRYAVLVGCIEGHTRDAPKRILDVGCGVGILREHLSEESVEHYAGIDVSNEAVEQARRHEHARSQFFVAAIDDWQPDRTYDAIVFNEVLYYLPMPATTVERYGGWLTKDGEIIVSMWCPALLLSKRRPMTVKALGARVKHERIWRDVGRRHDVVADILVRRSRLKSWRIQRLRPRLSESTSRRRFVT